MPILSPTHPDVAARADVIAALRDALGEEAGAAAGELLAALGVAHADTARRYPAKHLLGLASSAYGDLVAAVQR